MTPREPGTFDEFWPHYLGEHSRPATRALHAAGTCAGIATLALLGLRRKWRWLPVALIPAYATAWASHYLLEQNRPATFRHPLWSFCGDVKMLGLMLAGDLDGEIDRVKRL